MPETPPPPKVSDITENIQYMTLIHELRATHPVVPDDFVKDIVIKVSFFKWE